MIKGDVSANSLKSLSGTSLTVTYFPQKGTINITGGSDSQAEMIKDFIKANDKKQPQAYVEMQIVVRKRFKRFPKHLDIVDSVLLRQI